MHNVNGEQGKVVNAVDHMVHREKQQAEKDHRKPLYHSKAMIAEVRNSQNCPSIDRV